MSKKCDHSVFIADVKVLRLTDKEGGPVTGYSSEINVHCDLCGLAFRFVGVKAGSSPFEPRVSADATELRAPLEPAYVTEILGMPLTSGRT